MFLVCTPYSDGCSVCVLVRSLTRISPIFFPGAAVHPGHAEAHHVRQLHPQRAPPGVPRGGAAAPGHGRHLPLPPSLRLYRQRRGRRGGLSVRHRGALRAGAGAWGLGQGGLVPFKRV